MPLKLVRNELTRMRVDALVCGGDSLSASSGVDEKLRRAAGISYVREVRALGPIKIGEARLTSGHTLPCKIIIHVKGPSWRGGFWGEKRQLAADYKAALALAKNTDCESVALPLISVGELGFPREVSLQIAIDTIREFLQKEDLMVWLVLSDKQAREIEKRKYKNVQTFLDHRQTETASAVNAPEISFTELLLLNLAQKGLSDAACSKRANLDTKLLTRIRANAEYRPSKVTALAFAIALELPLHETRVLLSAAGFVLSPDSKTDEIIKYYMMQGNYDIFEINQALFAFGQNLLGA